LLLLVQVLNTAAADRLSKANKQNTIAYDPVASTTMPVTRLPSMPVAMLQELVMPARQ
jgi:hypothetical protein